MMYLYRARDVYIITQHTLRELKRHDIYGRDIELLSSSVTIQTLRDYAKQQHLDVIDLVKARFTGLTPEGRELLRSQKLGENNPNARGLSDEHKRKIAATQKKRRGEFHHMWNRQHGARSRLQCSVSLRETWRKTPMRWATDPNEKTHRISGALPAGWRWGRARWNAC